MTTIAATPYAAAPQRRAGVDRPVAGAGFAGHLAPAGGQSGATPPGRLQALQAELAELESRQSSLPVRDFLHASFTLKEQITTERVAAGEDLDVIGVQFAGQVYRLGGRFLGGLSELAETGEVRTVQLARPRGVLA